MARKRKPRSTTNAAGMKKYWKRVQKVSDTYNLSKRDARAFMKRGLFREVDTEGFERFRSRYRVKLSEGKPTYMRVTDGVEQEVPAAVVKGALTRSFYDAMVRRLTIWTGLTRAEVREYLASYENWKDGISPLFNEA